MLPASHSGMSPSLKRMHSSQSEGDVEMSGMADGATVFEGAQFNTEPGSNDSSPGITNTESTAKNRIGAGPLPTGHGMQSGLTTGSTLTEFTKRRNWSKLILDEIRDLLLIMSPDGRMQYVSTSCRMLVGYEQHEMKSRFLVDFIHPDDQSMFRRELNESIASQNQMRFFYRLRKADQQYSIFEAFGHPHFGTETTNGYPGNEPARFCRGVFLISRPYPTKNAALLDTFLEHKIENERLLRKIEELKREEQVELAQSEGTWSRKDGAMSQQGSEGRTEGKTEADQSNVPHYGAMPPPPRPTKSKTALTRQNLNDAMATSRTDSINDKMARYEGDNHVDRTIEMLTGLQRGESAIGISTGASSPSLMTGDLGIGVTQDRESRMSIDKKKKLKLVDEYVCTDCGTLDSPEWRKGPCGPKTLCNACGCKLTLSQSYHVRKVANESQ